VNGGYSAFRRSNISSYHGEMGGPVPNFMTVDTQTIDADMSIIDLAQLFL